MPSNITPGFLTIHGDHLEQLRSAVFEWLHDNPLAPLEQEIFLVQSNGVAEWLKIALAGEMGVCGATRITLPARFLWETYRAMLGPQRVPPRSPFDKSPLVWRLMRLLPGLLEQPGFEPLRHFLADGDPERRLQLAQRLSDLMDQYQVYRADWLADWAGGGDCLRRARGDALPLGAGQRWQAQLWRAVMADVAAEERTSGRSEVHRQFIAALEAGEPAAARLPRRVVLFGISALPYQALQALGALAGRTQVLLAVANPCRFHWGDIMEGRELLRAPRKRQPERGGLDLSTLPLEDLHAHSHPLLAGWGRLGRDFIRMLDEFDDAAASAERFSNLRIELFTEDHGATLLRQVQAAIRELLPLAEHPRAAPDSADRSIEFHVAHSVQREVEILHDQLLALLAEGGEQALRPRDIVVMVPDIEVFTPAVRAVFGQYGRQDARHIPFEIADLTERRKNPLLVALDWLLRLPLQRCLQSEVRDLLDVPALAARFGLTEADLPRLAVWIAGSGVRWGLDREHREGLGLGPAGEQNAWIFGMRRMLLGYASGADAAFAGIEPYPEVGGLDAALAGSLASLVEALLHWRARLAQPATPAEWGESARALLQTFFAPAEERDRLTCAQLERALQCWLEDCESCGFAEPVPLAVLREAWLGAIDEPSLNQRFVSGGVTFCTLMPMRAVPFRVVCLLGMNDGDFPRRSQHADFDLLAQPGLARPGDRARRDDDRYLMLEALLAARQKLYVSWVGRNVRDNSEQPPSVLISQLRDYLTAGWELDLARITTAHPLQPFSRRYFEPNGLLTYAREWRAAHAGDAKPEEAIAPARHDPGFRLQLADLAAFLRQPARYFFRKRLQVVFDDGSPVGQDDEPFGLDQLEEYGIASFLLDDSGPQEMPAQVGERLRARAARLAREGLLPIGAIGSHWQEQLVRELQPVRSAWLELCRQYPCMADNVPVSFTHGELVLEDWLANMRDGGAEPVWLALNPGRVASAKGALRGDKLIEGWLRQLCAAAMGHRVTGFLLARDGTVRMDPLEPGPARAALEALFACWREGMDRPLPTACKTALAMLAGDDPRSVYDGGFGRGGEAEEPCLARLWPDYDSLSSLPDWATWSEQLYRPLHDWLERHAAFVPLDGVAPARKAA